MEIPAVKNNGEEDNFKEILEWSDVWVMLLNAKGMFYLTIKNLQYVFLAKY